MKLSTKPTLIVSERGQVTLPANIRKKFGLSKGGIVTVEEHGGELILRPAAVLEYDIYSDDEISTWDQADKFDEKDRNDIRRKLTSGVIFQAKAGGLNGMLK